MEFYQKVHSTNTDSDNLKRLITIDSLPVLCSSIYNIIFQQENQADIYCLWGEFNLRRDEIRHGVRFSLLNCPHTLAWAITFDKVCQNIIVHCTIDKNEQEQEFIDSIIEFLEDCSIGITKAVR